ncbi:hypothetical protein LMH87_012218 [Akanthomyces muscarius]|uniref:Uncharacterized protein n=1 Tax=Akanthomyces muscarius TaxID=2231603 RepID=A0A9W8QBC9_AKAMU|nr:hypothetical protein LMH87_012218 [Akanthomyces muscarius]KAJ4151526.1 hypothetical protein LMH87_012218 [Akanthomyces muscarius]
MATATATVPSATAPALTALFTQPSECALLFTSLDIENTFTGGGPVEIRSYYQSNTANARFSSCNPPGWDLDNFTFSPAVCPSGWVYYRVTLTSSDIGQRAYTQACCCASGFTYAGNGQPNLPSQRCDSEPTSFAPSPGNETLSGADATTTMIVTMHQPFVAQWHESETKLLPFSLPSMASGAWLPTWTPRSKAEIVGGYRSYSNNKPLSDAILAIIAVGSILGFFVMIGLLWCCKHAMGE